MIWLVQSLCIQSLAVSRMVTAYGRRDNKGRSVSCVGVCEKHIFRMLGMNLMKNVKVFYVSSELCNVNEIVSRSAGLRKWALHKLNSCRTTREGFGTSLSPVPAIWRWHTTVGFPSKCSGNSDVSKKSLHHLIFCHPIQLSGNLWNIYDSWFNFVPWILETPTAISLGNGFFCCT